MMQQIPFLQQVGPNVTECSHRPWLALRSVLDMDFFITHPLTNHCLVGDYCGYLLFSWKIKDPDAWED